MEALELDSPLEPSTRGLLKTENCKVFRALPHLGHSTPSPLPRTTRS
jgi:hypothetical protein